MRFPLLHTRSALLRLLLVAAVVVSHCCLMGQTAHAAGVHADGGPAHGVTQGVAGFECQRVPSAPMACEGAHAVAVARMAVPAPAIAALPVPTAPAGGSLRWSPALVPDPPDLGAPSRALLQTYLI